MPTFRYFDTSRPRYFEISRFKYFAILRFLPFGFAIAVFAISGFGSPIFWDYAISRFRNSDRSGFCAFAMFRFSVSILTLRGFGVIRSRDSGAPDFGMMGLCPRDFYILRAFVFRYFDISRFRRPAPRYLGVPIFWDSEIPSFGAPMCRDFEISIRRCQDVAIYSHIGIL